MSVLYEGQSVTWSGGGFQARGHIVMVAPPESAHVKWATGPFAGNIVLENVLDLDPVTASVEITDDPLHLTAVRRAYDHDAETGVLNFLASNQYLDTWQKIARDVVEYVEDRIRVDASMELVEEQLTPQEQQRVVQAAAMALLHDAFSSADEDL